MSSHFDVLVLDLTSRTPPYDRALCEALIDYGHNVELWASGCHTDDFERMNVPRRQGLLDLVAHIPNLSAEATKQGKAVEYLVNLVYLTAHLWRRRPDIIHVQWLPLLEIFPIVEIAFLRLCEYWGIQVVYTVHDVLPLENGEEHYDTFWRVYHTADQLICHTKTACHQLSEEFDVSSSSTWLIPHGPLLEGAAEYLQDEARQLQSLPGDRPIVLLFGVLRPYKGVDLLIDAWKQVEQTVPEAILIIAGGGQEDYLGEIKEHIAASGTSNIRTRFQFLPENELIQLVASADLLVYPYRRITQSGALLAGMSAGQAIVASSVGGLKETLQDGKTARLIEPNDSEELAGAITHLLRNPDERDQLGNAAKTVVEEKYSWGAIAQKTTQCYREVVEKTSDKT
ncbi:glycosyltransferase family 4 protein [Salinibacter ruber]|uniref:Glycosyltransferase involved in cell wall biosynthesis n=1 Tax=Salinibacter ruber TaxID=146919 RepID=A0A9X2U6X5_9BACT|nr:glycosyltransferase family 4 protein [Salinibacter ruber]MCS3950918.1 glycosyltransferase involved in cell wall biosynthesis [Salinibacter ruber]